jgi:hypothetical protein
VPIEVEASRCRGEVVPIPSLQRLFDRFLG